MRGSKFVDYCDYEGHFHAFRDTNETVLIELLYLIIVFTKLIRIDVELMDLRRSV